MRRVVLASIVSLAGAGALGCGSSTKSVTGPSTSKCAVSPSATPSSFSASGGSGTLTVSTNRECQWTASASGSWIQLGSASGQGEASVAFTVASNGDPVARQASITVGTGSVGIAQEPAPCTFTVNPTADSASPGGERRTISITASSQQCSWTTRSDVDWLTIVGSTQGAGNGQVTYEARATTGPSRTGTLLVAGQVVTITQGEGCTASISPSAQTMPALGGMGTISVSTSAGCPWAAQSNAGWISITSGQSGTGSGTVGFTVAAWDGPARSATITVNGQAFTVTQESGCTYTIEPSSESIAPAGGSGGVNVHSASGCGWTASSNAPWIAISSGAAGSGDGRVQFTVAASAGPARSGTLTVAGRTYTVDQASGCSYTLVPTSSDVTNAAGSGSFAVNTTDGCSWTATSNASSWLTIVGPSTGSGSGTVNYQYSGNAMGGYPRTGTITVNGQTFTLNQAAGVPCVYVLSPSSMDVAAAAGSGSFSVQTVLTCPWTAVSNAPWITIVGPPGGAGDGTVNFSYAENPAGSPARTGTITVTGQTFTLIQGAPAGPGE